jgi:hypothetical protein
VLCSAPSAQAEDLIAAPCYNVVSTIGKEHHTTGSMWELQTVMATTGEIAKPPLMSLVMSLTHQSLRHPLPLTCQRNPDLIRNLRWRGSSIAHSLDISKELTRAQGIIVGSRGFAFVSERQWTSGHPSINPIEDPSRSPLVCRRRGLRLLEVHTNNGFAVLAGPAPLINATKREHQSSANMRDYALSPDKLSPHIHPKTARM